MLLDIYECRLPVIGAIHKMCIGAGMDFICGFDFKICTRDWYSFVNQVCSAFAKFNWASQQISVPYSSYQN